MRPFAIPDWSLVLPYEPSGLYTVQINLTATKREYEVYMLASAGVSFADWANPILIRQAQAWKHWGPGPQIPRLTPTQVIRFCTIVTAQQLYKKTAANHGYLSLSKWVRAALNNEVGL